MESVAKIDSVRTVETRGGNTRYVVRDSDGNEYTTFREAIGRRAQELNGARVRIHYHEEKRGQYKNVYVDKREPVEADAPPVDTDAQEAAWRTAVEAAPWLVGEPREEVPPEELYDKAQAVLRRAWPKTSRGPSARRRTTKRIMLLPRPLDRLLQVDLNRPERVVRGVEDLDQD
jgi:hypothetical protein